MVRTKPLNSSNSEIVLDAMFDPAADPIVGRPILSNRELSEAVLSAPKGMHLLVAALGDCHTCSVNKLDHRITELKSTWRIAIYQKDSSEAGRVASIDGFDRLVAVSPKEFAKLNAIWRPRLYLLDSRGNLIRSQAKGEAQSDFDGELN